MQRHLWGPGPGEYREGEGEKSPWWESVPSSRPDSVTCLLCDLGQQRPSLGLSSSICKMGPRRTIVGFFNLFSSTYLDCMIISVLI